LIGALLSAIGGWVRWLLASNDKVGFAMTFIGHTLAAIGQVYIVGATPKVAAVWFGTKERIAATSIGFVFNTLGTGVGFLVSPAIVTVASKIPLLLFVYAVTTSIFTALFALFFKDKPPTPPSFSAVVPKEDFKRALKQLMRNPHYILLCTAFGVMFGGYFGVITLLEQIASVHGYSDQIIGVIGFVIMLGGVVGALSASAVDHLHKYYRLVTIISFFASSISFITFNLAISRPHNLAPIMVTSLIFGFFVNLNAQISIQSSVEISFPVAEETSANVSIMSMQFWAIVFIAIMSGFGTKGTALSWFITVCAGAVSVAMLFYRGQYKRVEAEDEQEKQRQKQQKLPSDNGLVEH